MDFVDLVEKRVGEYFPTSWKKADINKFLGSSGFERDVKALDQSLNKPIRDFVLRGGKRLRPRLFEASMEAFGVSPKKYIDFAVMIELVHNGTLVLDDIEDDGELRRGRPTTHKKYGLDVATNVGAALHFLPLKIINGKMNALGDKQKPRIFTAYVEELVNVSFGQALDIHWHNDPNANLSVERYLEMVRLKTGSLMRMSMRTACVLADQEPEVEQDFSSFAQDLGIAFQVIDDKLDLAPPNDRFGKSYGNDITESKISLPVLYALESLEAKSNKRLRYILGLHTKNRRMIEQAVRLINRSGAVERADKFAKEMAVKAWGKLEKKYNRKYELDGLRAIASFFVERDY